jgi:hypothetical protein
MNRFDVGISSEIPLIESKNLLDAVNSHCRDQTGIVDLHSDDVMCDQEFTPFLVNGQIID